MKNNLQSEESDYSDTDSVATEVNPDETIANNNHKQRKTDSSMKNFLWGILLYSFCLSAPFIYNHCIRHLSLLNITERFDIVSNKLFEYIFHLLPMNVHHQQQQNLLSALKWIAFFSNSLAVARILLVYALVPRYLAPRRLAAFMRCKSMTLLSSSSTFASPSPQTQAQPTLRRVGSELDEYFQDMRNAIQRSLGHEDATAYENLSYEETQQMFAAPRFATAIFRLLYCSISSILALYLFRSSDFWPKYLLGVHPNASTRHCWNLSAGLAILGHFENDFDHFNVSLTHFFIFAASYQLQSLCFHLFSMLLLCFSQAKSFLSIASSIKAYIRPFSGHIVSLLLLIICFVFSSLRRLGAIGIFAMDFSAIFLNLLQACINAPSTSILKNQKFIRTLYFAFVLPSFLYIRFFILPFVVWYSAAFESLQWLQQMEHAIVPGLANIIYAIVNTLLFILIILNTIHLKRLLYHKKVWRYMGME